MAPRFWVEREGDGDGPGSILLGIAGTGGEAVDGRWVRRVPVQDGRSYRFSAEYKARGVATPERSVLARLLWFDAQGRLLKQPEYPATQPEARSDGWTTIATTYQAPKGATEAQLELQLRWAPDGEVLWREARLVESAPPPPRTVRLASVNHRPGSPATPEQNVEAFAALVAQAAERGADIVCLPEGITVVGTGRTYAEVAEPIPGPTTRRLGETALAHKVYVVAGLYEREGSAVYNTGVLIDRDGKLLGTYRKVCLPREEIDGGITPGSEYPVFDTDFGRVGMMICWDVHFPEVARELARRGAEVILMPIWGGNETLARARAIENQLYLVASGYDFQTAIYDRAGEPVATTTDDPGLIFAEVDLNDRLIWQWLGDWRARIWREGPAPLPTSAPADAAGGP